MFYLFVRGAQGGKDSEEGGRDEEVVMGGLCGTSRRDERGLSLFYSPCLSSFQLFEASHQTGLNSRRDTICLPSTAITSSLVGISPTHPSIRPSLAIYLDSVFYLPAAPGVRPPNSLAHNAAQ